VVKNPKGKLPAGIAEIPGYVVKWCMQFIKMAFS
jgi:hypothetical protein